MVYGLITSQQIDGETMETVTDFIFLRSKMTADGDCSHEIKTPAPWKKSYDQPRQHIVEKAMAPHSNTLAWKIPWMEEPDRLQSMGSLRVRHD